MLINCSNHPSSSWSDNQLQTATSQYGSVMDIPFPKIDPNGNTEYIGELADKYLSDILKTSPKAVHLMGEMTFTFNLVKKLNHAGIPCLASTTERLVKEKEGKKIVEFKFVQFREYV